MTLLEREQLFGQRIETLSRLREFSFGHRDTGVETNDLGGEPVDRLLEGTGPVVEHRDAGPQRGRPVTGPVDPFANLCSPTLDPFEAVTRICRGGERRRSEGR